MEVTYSLTAGDLLWQTARSFLHSQALVFRRLAGIAAYALLGPIVVAILVAPHARGLIGGLLLLEVVACLLAAALVVVFGRRLLSPILGAPVDNAVHSIVIGPDCFAETGGMDVVTPWQYVRSVKQDFWTVFIEIDDNQSYAIPRRAFRSYAASWAFSFRAWRYWRGAAPRSRA